MITDLSFTLVAAEAMPPSAIFSSGFRGTRHEVDIVNRSAINGRCLDSGYGTAVFKPRV